jgi:outer membrane protein assembly factor BamE
MKTFLIYTFSLFVLLLSGCNKDKIPGVYRIDIQQGNDVTQEMINKLKPGMAKNQVAFIMGTPLLIDTFHPNRWDYVYSFHPGNGQREQRRITLFFDDKEKLSHLRGDINIVDKSLINTDEQAADTNLVVPLNEKETGFFDGLLNAVGLGDDEPEVLKPEEVKTDDSPVTDTPVEAGTEK